MPLSSHLSVEDLDLVGDVSNEFPQATFSEAAAITINPPPAPSQPVVITCDTTTSVPNSNYAGTNYLTTQIWKLEIP